MQNHVTILRWDLKQRSKYKQNKSEFQILHRFVLESKKLILACHKGMIEENWQKEQGGVCQHGFEKMYTNVNQTRQKKSTENMEGWKKTREIKQVK